MKGKKDKKTEVRLEKGSDDVIQFILDRELQAECRAFSRIV